MCVCRGNKSAFVAQCDIIGSSFFKKFPQKIQTILVTAVCCGGCITVCKQTITHSEFAERSVRTTSAAQDIVKSNFIKSQLWIVSSFVKKTSTQQAILSENIFSNKGMPAYSFLPLQQGREFKAYTANEVCQTSANTNELLLLLQSALQLLWVLVCSIIVEYSQQEDFTECLCQQHVKPPTWRTNNLKRSNSRHKESPASETTQTNPSSERWKYGRETAENFAESGVFHVTFGLLKTLLCILNTEIAIPMCLNTG